MFLSQLVWVLFKSESYYLWFSIYILIFNCYFVALKFKKKTALAILKKKVPLQSMENALLDHINFRKLINRLYCVVFSFHYASSLNSYWLFMTPTLETHTRCVNELCRIWGIISITKKNSNKRYLQGKYLNRYHKHNSDTNASTYKQQKCYWKSRQDTIVNTSPKQCILAQSTVPYLTQNQLNQAQ